MTITLRRFPMTFAPLALLVGPIGCGSDSPSTPVVEVPANPTAVDGSAPMQPAPAAYFTGPAPAKLAFPTASAETPANLDQAAQVVDQDVRRTAGAVKDEVGDLKAGATRSADEAVDGAKDLGEKARQDTEAATNRIKGGVHKAINDAKGKVRDAEGGARKAAEDAKAEAERRAKAVQDDARKAAESAIDNLLGNPK